ncbi:MAG: MFS transporter [Anaerolineae bacterium]|nr:MFS transporter [Anaerolineae bacterium]
MRLRASTYVTMNVYWFGLAVLWNALHPIVLPAVLLDFVPESLKNTTLGALTFAGLVLAMIVQPIAGAMSDRTTTRWGRRRPWMVGGTVISIVCLLLMARAQNLAALALTYILLQLASNTAHGPAQGLIPDMVPAAHRGLASGLKNLFDMGGLVVTSLVAGQLMAAGNPGLALLIVAIVLLLSTLLTVVATPEPLSAAKDVPLSGPSGKLREALAAYPAYTRLLVSRFLILLGIYVVQSFAQYYIRDWLGLPSPAAVTGNLMAAIGVALTLLVFPAGWLSDRLGRWPLNIAAGIAAAVGLFLLVLVRDVTMLYVVGALIGMATGVFLSVNWALATDLIPQDEGGKYLGLSNLATAGAGAASRLGGPLIDGLNALLPGSFVGYPATFALAAFATLTGALLLARLRRRVRGGTMRAGPDGTTEELATGRGL